MKERWKDAVMAVMMGLVLPYILLNAAGMMHESPHPGIETASSEDPYDREVIWIHVQNGEAIEQMDLESYLVRVVLGEMPASFELEALKAQAVVARTYTLRRLETGTKHRNADVCTDPGCCQAYCDPAYYQGSVESLGKVRDAVEQTRGLVLTYSGALIEATYFSSSGGRTEDAVAVWGNDLPYLQATDSPENGYEDQYLRSVTFSAADFRVALDRELPGGCHSWFGPVTYTNGGGVATMTIGGEEYSGTELRQLLGLRSTAFTVSATSNTVTITTRGYGHRVGMSQYGAEAMAVEGAAFDAILAHYYQGTALEEYIDNPGDIS